MFERRRKKSRLLDLRKAFDLPYMKIDILSKICYLNAVPGVGEPLDSLGHQQCHLPVGSVSENKQTNIKLLAWKKSIFIWYLYVLRKTHDDKVKMDYRNSIALLSGKQNLICQIFRFRSVIRPDIQPTINAVLS